MPHIEFELVRFSAGAEPLEVMRELHEEHTCYGKCRALAVSRHGDAPCESEEEHTERKL